MRNEKQKDHKHGKPFSDVCSCIEKEWLDEDITIPDDSGVAAARARLDGSYERATELINALCFQLRYKESYEICKQLYKTHRDYALQRRLGVLCFKLLKFGESEKYLEKCLETTSEKLQILYILATVKYYKGDYARAKSLLELCTPLCIDDGEMFVAVLYWYACCLARLDLPLDGLTAMSKTYDFDCGHHTGYDAAVRYALGLCSEADAVRICKKDTGLNRCCLYYGLSVLLERNDAEKSTVYLEKSLSSREWFGAFSYIAAYVDRTRRNTL